MQISNTNILFTGYQGNNILSGQEKKQAKSPNEMIKEAMDKALDYTEEEENQLNASISQKLKSGAKLTPEEIRYLQKKNPMLYMKILMLEKKREILERKLKNCKSKEEVNDILAREVSMINKDDPDKEMKLKSILNTEKEFKKTDYYKRLPDRQKKLHS